MRTILAPWLLLSLAVGACKCAESKPATATKPAVGGGPTVGGKPEEGRPAITPEPLGGGLNVAAEASASTGSLVVGADGKPVIAWQERNEVHVRRWTGAAWEVVGGGPASGALARATGVPQLSIGRDQKVWVGWTRMNDRDLTVGQVTALEDKGWAQVGGELGAKGHVRGWAFSAQTSPPLFVWSEFDGERERQNVRQLDGAAWQPVLTGKLFVDDGADAWRAPSLVALADGTPVVGWIERAPGRIAAQVQKLEQGKWVPLPALDQAADGDSELKVTAADDGTLYASLSYNPGLRPLRMLPPGSATWAEVPLPNKAGGPIALAAGGKSLVLSFANNGMQLARWKDRAWQVLDPKVFSGFGNPVPVAVSATGEVYASWQDTGPEGGAAAQLKAARYRPAP